MKGCGKRFNHHIWGERICGMFEDLKHSDHYIYCEECLSKIVIRNMEKITISKDVFDDIAPYLKPYMKDYCNYCGRKITKDSFGLLSREITTCNSIICLAEAILDEDELNSVNEKVA